MSRVAADWKPDLGAAPADLVFGEGVAVPGNLLSKTPENELATPEDSKVKSVFLRV